MHANSAWVWGRHNTTKCAISSMLNGGQYPQYLPSPMVVPPQPIYVPTVPTPHTVPSVFTGMLDSWWNPLMSLNLI